MVGRSGAGQTGAAAIKSSNMSPTFTASLPLRGAHGMPQIHRQEIHFLWYDMTPLLCCALFFYI